MRRTAAVRTVATVIATRRTSFLPSYGTVARALACEPDDLQGAVDALFDAGYPVTRPPIAPEHLAWFGQGRP